MNILCFYGYSYGLYDIKKLIDAFKFMFIPRLSYKAYNRYRFLLFRTYNAINTNSIVVSMKLRLSKIIVNYDYY